MTTVDTCATDAPKIAQKSVDRDWGDRIVTAGQHVQVRTARSCSCGAPTEGGNRDAQEMLPPAVSFFVGRGEAIVSPGSASSSAPGTSTWRFGSASWNVAASNAAVRTSRGFRSITLTVSMLGRHAGHRRCARSSSRRASIGVSLPILAQNDPRPAMSAPGAFLTDIKEIRRRARQHLTAGEREERHRPPEPRRGHQGLVSRAATEYVEGENLVDMIKESLVAEKPRQLTEEVRLREIDELVAAATEN